MTLERGTALLVSYYFPPDSSPGALRMSAFARDLSERGWRVIVLSTVARGGREADVAWEPPLPDSIRIVRTRAFDVYWWLRSRAGEPGTDVQAGGLKRTGKKVGRLWWRVVGRLATAILWPLRFPDKRAGWFWPLVFTAGRLIRSEKVDVVLCSTPPHSSQYALAFLRRFVEFRWVADFRDPWTAPRRQQASGVSQFVLRRMERRVLSACDQVLANTMGNRDELERVFGNRVRGKVTVVTNAFDERHPVDPHLEHDDLAAADIVYVGELYPGMLDLYIEAVHRMRSDGASDTPILHVYGDVDPDTRGLARSRLGAEVAFKGVVSPSQSYRVMRDARSLLLLLPMEPRWATCVPSKMYPYLFTERPVLAIVPEGDAARILRSTGAGVAVTASDPAELAAELTRLLAMVRRDGVRAARVEEELNQYRFSAVAETVDKVLVSLRGDGDG